MRARDLGMFAFLASMSASQHRDSINYYSDKEPKEPVTPPMPKGCSSYYFSATGLYKKDREPHFDVVFVCIALNDKTALKKYERFKLLNK